MTDVHRVDLAPNYSVAKIVNGCWQLTPDHGGGPRSKQETLRRFAELVDYGFTTFDCADIYAGTEELLGDFRKTLTEPDKIQIHTKFVPDKSSLAALDGAKIDAIVDRSLTRLGVDKLDLLQFHWWDYSMPGLYRTYERLLRAQEIGKIRLLGVTNFNTRQLQRLVQRDASIVSTQSQYSLLDRRPERQMTSYCLQTDIGLLPYGVLAGGFLSDKYLGRPEPGRMNRSLQKYRLVIDEIGGWDLLQRLLRVLAGIGEKHDTSIDTIAARWVLDRPAVAAIILGIGRQSKAKENRTICEVQLDDADRRSIRDCLQELSIPQGDPYDLERDAESIHSTIIRTDLQDAGEGR